MALLLAKGERLEEWRGVDEFVAVYRDAAVRAAAAREPASIADTLATVVGLLAHEEQEDRRSREAIAQLLLDLAQPAEPADVRQRLSAYYEQCYAGFRRCGSAPAFFEAANRLLVVVTQLLVEAFRRDLECAVPPFAVVALGPAGRSEYTRFCRVQLALVWDCANDQACDELMEQLGAALVAGLRTCGVQLDEAISPLQQSWRGSLVQWRDRLELGIARGTALELVELLRLVDQAVLYDCGGTAARFRALCSEQLQRHHAVTNMSSRTLALSNGLGLMGGFRLERSGPHKGRFNLLDHALVPLAACVAAICLVNELQEDGTPQRLRELVRNGRIDVDLAERSLAAWYLLSEHRLTLELQALPGQDCRDILNLDVSELGDEGQEELRTALETVASLQRHLQSSFGQSA